MNINKSALKVIDVLNSNGHEAFFAGGCVRNYLMNMPPNDFDIATSASVEELKNLFNYRTIGSGEKHGTVLIMLDGIDNKIEVTTYRNNAKTLREDLMHRDFTINAMAYHPKKGIIDLFGGKNDIENKLIRAVINPNERFIEDPLRILRGLRFASVYGFSIEEKTACAIHEMSGLLKSSAPERIQSELTKILCGKNIERVMLDFPDVFCSVIPEMKNMINFQQHNPHHYLDVYSHTAKVVSGCKNSQELRWAALLHDIAKPECSFIDEKGVGHFYGHNSKGAEIAENIMDRLRFDNASKKIIYFLIKYHCINFPENIKSARRLLFHHGQENIMKLLDLQHADLLGHVFNENIMENYYNGVKLINQAIEENNCLTIKNLAVNGYDMMNLGLNGPEIGIALNRILEAVVDGKIKNDHDEIMRFCAECYNTQNS